LNSVGDKKSNQALIGMVRAVPIILGYLPIGLAFGVLASTAGVGIYGAVAMSVFVFAGSSQLIAVGMIGAGAEMAAITMTVFLVNLRHMLMSAYLAPYLGGLSRFEQALFSYELTDESFAIHSSYFRQQGVPSKRQLFSLNLSAHLAWVGGTFLGSLLGERLTLDIETYGIHPCRSNGPCPLPGRNEPALRHCCHRNCRYCGSVTEKRAASEDSAA